MKRCFECLYNLINFPSLFSLCRSRAGGVGGAATVPARLVSANMQNDKVQRVRDQAHVPRLQGTLPERNGERRHFQANLCAIFSSGRLVKAFLIVQSISFAVAFRLIEGVAGRVLYFCLDACHLQFKCVPFTHDEVIGMEHNVMQSNWAEKARRGGAWGIGISSAGGIWKQKSQKVVFFVYKLKPFRQFFGAKSLKISLQTFETCY